MKNLLKTLLLFQSFSTLQAGEIRDTMPDTWAATDALGRKLPMHDEVGSIKANRTAGIFYFNWQDSFGNQEVYDIAKIIKKNHLNPAWGPVQAPHYWSEPRFGYYRPDDPWIIRKHIQMLVDAGVDVLILDVTNGFPYDNKRDALFTVLEQLQKEGRRTPQIAMFAYANHQAVVQHLWKNLYQPKKFQTLWFHWKGRPLLITPTEGLSTEVKEFFTIRTSWAWTRGQTWFGNGKDKWPWLDHAPQLPGWHESPDKPECISVAVSQHVTSNIGRSYHKSRQPSESEYKSELGLFFEEQWTHALPHKPEFIFITGWNEWVAQRFISDGRATFKGRILPTGETFFVDLYDPEFSRDIEPMRNGFGDNYYWQMIAGIRKYKGVREMPAFSLPKTISIPGSFSQWNDVQTRYLDDLHDTEHRDYDGVPGAGRYTNKTGRNDLDTFKVAYDNSNLYFYGSTREKLSSPTGKDWMVLLIDIDQNPLTGRLGYDFRINKNRFSPAKASVEKWNGKTWEPVGDAILQSESKELHLAVKRSLLRIEIGMLPQFDFKWTDNIPTETEGLDFLDVGDTAPNARFNYRHTPTKRQ